MSDHSRRSLVQATAEPALLTLADSRKTFGCQSGAPHSSPQRRRRVCGPPTATGCPAVRDYRAARPTRRTRPCRRGCSTRWPVHCVRHIAAFEIALQEHRILPDWSSANQPSPKAHKTLPWTVPRGWETAPVKGTVRAAFTSARPSETRAAPRRAAAGQFLLYRVLRRLRDELGLKIEYLK